MMLALENSNLTSASSQNMHSKLSTGSDEDSLIGVVFELSRFERLIWIIVFTVMVLIAAGGNTIVVYIVLTNKQMKSVTNYFLVNLSVADTMVSILNVVFNFISMLHRLVV